MDAAVGRVTSLWRFPVKSMLGERLPLVEVTDLGVLGDRAYGLVDRASGKVLSAKSPGIGSELLRCRARFPEPPSLGQQAPDVLIGLPDGSTVRSGAAGADAGLSAFLGRDVVLERSSPADFTIDEYHPALRELGGEDTAERVTESQLGAAFFAQAGLPSAVAPGSFLDLFPVSLLTTSTLSHLGALSPGSSFDERRFRMNVVMDCHEKGFAENGWIGHSLQIGGAVRLAVMLPDPRCVMTTLAQEDLPRDNAVLGALARHNRLDVAGRPYPCAGVYAVVGAPGSITVGDTVRLV